MSSQDSTLRRDESLSPDEERLGAFLDEALRRLERGEPVEVSALLADRPDLIEQANLLVANLASWRAALSPGPDSPPVASGADIELPAPLSAEYRVEGELGRGTFGRVLLAQELSPLGRKVAIKTLHFPEDAPVPGGGLAALQRDARFLAEVQQKRPHPNVVQVYSWRQVGDRHFLIMQHVPGPSLDRLVAESGPLDWQRAGRYVADVGEGLLAVQALGILHRDVKPANILLDEERDEVVLTDLGISARLAAVRAPAGSPLYMAPEALRGEATERSDVYSLAATLFFLIAGAVPFQAVTQDELPEAIARGLPRPDPRCAGMPEALELVLRKGLSADVGTRPDLEVFLRDLRGALNQALADLLASGCRGGVGDLRLLVSRQVGAEWLPVALTQRAVGPERDVRQVPRQAGRVKLRTGDAIRIEVESGRDGYVTVFNVGPTGNLNLLYPDEPHGPGAAPDVRAEEPLHILELMLEPPAGRERLFAVWSAWPLSLSRERMRSLAEGGLETRAYLASRDLGRLQQVVGDGGQEGARVAVVELDHGPGA